MGQGNPRVMVTHRNPLRNFIKGVSYKSIRSSGTLPHLKWYFNFSSNSMVESSPTTRRGSREEISHTIFLWKGERKFLHDIFSSSPFSSLFGVIGNENFSSVRSFPQQTAERLTKHTFQLRQTLLWFAFTHSGSSFVSCIYACAKTWKRER